MNFEAYFKVSYGMYVVSARNAEKLGGYISNTVFQVTAEPPRFAATCNKNNYTASLILASGAFAFSVLKKDCRSEIIGTFGYKSSRDSDKFSAFKHKTAVTHSPILLDDCLAWFDCKLVETFEIGTHYIFIGEVVDGDLMDSNVEPFTYQYYREVKKGSSPKNAPTYIDKEKLNPHPDVVKFYCPTCGYEYNPATGDSEHGIPPGTSFEALPENWVCPLCGTEKSDFVEKKD